MMAKKHKRLRGRIVEKYNTIGEFAEKAGMSRAWIGMKLSGTADFSAKDIRRWSELLEIEPDDIGSYFFD